MLETSTQRRLSSVQALRGLAAVLVLMLHCAAVQTAGLSSANSAELAYLKGPWSQGYAGVDLFFVISGFIMVYVTYNRDRTLGNIGRFLYSRASRIYPLWWIYAGIMASYFLITYGQAAAPDVVVSPEDMPAYAVKSMLLLPQAAYPVLGVGWTLIHEMYFYVIFALILLFSRKFTPIALCVWGALVLMAMALLETPVYAINMGALITSPLTLEFIAGGLAGWLVVTRRYFQPKLIAAIGVLTTLAALCIGLVEVSGKLVLNRVWLYTLPFAALIYGLSVLEHQNKLQVPKWCVRLGDWSYSLYLSHMLVLLTLRRIFMRAGDRLPEALQYQSEGYLDNLFFAVVAFVAAIVFSGISHRLIETPLLKVFRSVLQPKPLAQN